MKTSILTMSKEGQTDSNKCKTVISVWFWSGQIYYQQLLYSCAAMSMEM
jgi:hypothetical protein